MVIWAMKIFFVQLFCVFLPGATERLSYLLKITQITSSRDKI